MASRCPSDYEVLSTTGTDSRLMRYAFYEVLCRCSQALTRAAALCIRFGVYDIFLLEISSQRMASMCPSGYEVLSMTGTDSRFSAMQPARRSDPGVRRRKRNNDGHHYRG